MSMKITSKPMVFRLDTQTSLRSAIRDLLQQAESRQKQDLGTMFLGAVLQHLVGAKLELVLGHQIEAHGAFVADNVTDRAGDYAVEDVVVHYGRRFGSFNTLATSNGQRHASPGPPLAPPRPRRG